jgi:chorismate mutase
MDRAAPDPLQVVRGRIDAIDAEMHRLLIERAGVIAELIRIKGTSKPGAAFRPDREADMMRRMVMRHEGDLPLATLEHIWREIITTFTAMQAPFTVVAGPAADPLAMRDLVRFYFGFSVPVETAETSAAAVERISRSRQAVAVVAAGGQERWWGGLPGADAPKVFARLPFMELPGRPADLPAYVAGPPLKEPLTPDIRLLSMREAPGLDNAVRSFGGTVSARAGGELLVELPVAASLGEVAREAGIEAVSAEELGGFCQPIRFVAERVA